MKYLISFNSDGTLESNQDLCDSFFNAEEITTQGIYDITTAEITPDDCADRNPFFGFSIDGRVLTITYSCFEGCGQRLRKLR